MANGMSLREAMGTLEAASAILEDSSHNKAFDACFCEKKNSSFVLIIFFSTLAFPEG